MPNELCREHKLPIGVCNGLKIVPQIQGTISFEPILPGRPPLLRAHCVPSDTQWMGSHDWALHVVCGAEDESFDS